MFCSHKGATTRENRSLGFPTRSDTNRPVQLQEMARSLKFWIQKEEELYYPCIAKTKALISLAVTVKLICASSFLMTRLKESLSEQNKSQSHSDHIHKSKIWLESEILSPQRYQLSRQYTSCVMRKYVVGVSNQV